MQHIQILFIFLYWKVEQISNYFKIHVHYIKWKYEKSYHSEILSRSSLNILAAKLNWTIFSHEIHDIPWTFFFFFTIFLPIFFIIIIIWNWYKLAQENLPRIVNKDVMTSLPTHYTCMVEINHAAGSPICWSDSMIVEKLWFILSC